ncbi:MAG TPA: hypothetical protein VLI90_11110 [Tepidisphaeraceae bacterium]|nr:hypothetical protein [Tepidisphaeraceae bacterium]
MVFRVLFVATFFMVTFSNASNARPFRSYSAPRECNVTMPCDFTGMRQPQIRTSYRMMEQRVPAQPVVNYRNAMASADAMAGVDSGRVVGGRPAGCPNSFCGCGASLRVFGRIVPGLNLAANWLRFPRTAPAPGMVAARRGHVFVLEQQVAGDTWMAYDANSGGHATRIHARSLRGYTVVNPHAA